MTPEQLDLFKWAQNRPSAQIIDIVPIIVRNMPDFDHQYEQPAQVIQPERFRRQRSVA